VPSLSQLPASECPSFFVTSSLLWQEPMIELFSLSLVKSSQRNLVVSLARSYPGTSSSVYPDTLSSLMRNRYPLCTSQCRRSSKRGGQIPQSYTDCREVLGVVFSAKGTLDFGFGDLGRTLNLTCIVGCIL
jgi:hypothetical protein